MEKTINEIERLLGSCFKDLADYAMGLERPSPKQLSNINTNLRQISSLIEKLKTEQEKTSKIEKIYTRNSIPKEEKKDLIKVAYALSRFNHEFFYDILHYEYKQPRLSQKKTISILSDLFIVKSTTLRNYRDMFDPHIQQERSDRKGRNNEKLPPDFEDLKSQWESKNEDSIKDEIKNILSKYRNMTDESS
jgi:hypothetical protein